jgi:predicted nucleic-acid-binding protein
MRILNFKKFTNWEYWPSYMFYIPVVPYALLLAIKSRSFGFFSAVNPAIEGSGNGLESKYETIQLLPEKYKPKTIFIKNESTFSNISPNLINENIDYPLIIKPDIGFRGLLVKKINSENELKDYISKYNSINLIIQEFIEYKNECGIFYYKLPNSKSGEITSITLKRYMTITGDGSTTLLQLILNDKRACRYTNLLSELNKDKLNTIPTKNKNIVLSMIGNHSKGTQFINGNNLISKELVNFFDKLNSEIPGWYYGRVDIKYNDFNELLKGENLKIIEINGVISEPTHIYDANNGTYFDALISIKNHWKIIYQIGVQNKKLKNSSFTNLKYFINLYFTYKKYLKKIRYLSSSC